MLERYFSVYLFGFGWLVGLYLMITTFLTIDTVERKRSIKTAKVLLVYNNN